MEIEEVYMGLTAGLWIRPPTPERVSGGGAHDMQHRLALAHKIRYLPWARVMGRQLALVVDILIDTRFLSDLAETYGQPQGELKRRFLRALLTYALMARWTDHEELADFDQLHGGAVPTP